MCVIAVFQSTRPTLAEVEAMWDANPQGGGIAYRDTQTFQRSGSPKEEPVVRWHKGLKLGEMTTYCLETAPLPFVAHFRIPTCCTDQILTHPFPIDPAVPLAFKGSTRGYVLFHNGHWTSWKSVLMEMGIRKGNKIPPGRWSDSRALAWTAAKCGLGILEALDEKVVAFGPQTIEIYGGQGHGGWKFFEERYWVSNDTWAWRARNNYSVTDRRGDNRGILNIHGTAREPNDKEDHSLCDTGLASSSRQDLETGPRLLIEGRGLMDHDSGASGGAPADLPFSLAIINRLLAGEYISRKQYRKIRGALTKGQKLQPGQRSLLLDALRLERAFKNGLLAEETGIVH